MNDRLFRRALVWAALLSLMAAGHSGAQDAGPSQVGRFSAPFAEPNIDGRATPENCRAHSHGEGQAPHEHCKPSAGSVAILRRGSGILYWNALEGTENIQNGVATEFGTVSVNDQARIMRFRRGRPSWKRTLPSTSGANPGGYGTEPLIPGAATTETYNDGALFCADLNLLADGRLLVAGGTAYYGDPGLDGAPASGVELEGLRTTRVFDPKRNRWTQVADMHHGRWYPSMVTLGDGRVLVAGGVQKLIKPIYPSHVEDSGRNVVRTETFDPRTGRWTDNGASGERSLPLFPRLHLLPNGHVYYNAAGQVFNPFGQSYDEVTWNLAASYDPKANGWTTLGVPGVGTTMPGFRGSTFSVMLPLVPDGSGRYTRASFLSAGGIAGVTPGTYVAQRSSAVTTVDTARGNAIATEATGDLNEARWYSTAVLLPTGEVMAFSGADRDEVDLPGTGFPINRAELFDPRTKTWRPMASSRQSRTYHNSAALLPDGRVLVGGHAPIPTLYSSHRTLPGGFSPNEGRDPTFEIYSPPYLFRGKRPAIVDGPEVVRHGKRINVRLDIPARDVESVVLVRNATVTHLVDGDQRSVVLRVLKRRGRTVTLAGPSNGNVAPPGPYLLFVNRKDARGPVPSKGLQVRVARPR